MVSKEIEEHTRAVAQQLLGAFTVLLSEMVSGMADQDREVADGVFSRLRDARRKLEKEGAPSETLLVFDALTQMLQARDARFRPPGQ